MSDISLFSNEELLELAIARRLITTYTLHDHEVRLTLGEQYLILSPARARVFLRGVLWGTRVERHGIGCSA